MTKEEYLKLVKSSGAFQQMDQETQNKILTAEGDDMAAYAKIFLTEQKEVVAAKREFVTTTVRVVENFDKNAKVIITVERRKQEDKAQKEDEQQTERLLSEINNL